MGEEKEEEEEEEKEEEEENKKNKKKPVMYTRRSKDYPRPSILPNSREWKR